MENIYDNMQILHKFKINSEQLALENNVTISSDDEASKVLSASARVDLDYPIECLNKECNVSGNVILNVVYLCEDGSLNNQTAKSPFNYKLQNDLFDTNCKVNVKASVVSTNIDKLQNSQIKILTTLNFDGVAIKNEEKSYLKEAGENTFVKQRELNVVAFDRQICDRFEENLQASVKDGVKKVLMTNVDYVIKDYNVGTNFVSVEGELYAKVLYANNQEVSELQTITITKAFKQELEADGLNKDCNLDVFAHIVNENVQVELEEKENGETIFDVNVPFLVCYNTYVCNNVLAVDDIYSTQDVLAITLGEGDSFSNLSPEIVEGKIEGNVVLTDNDPRIDKYLATTNVCNTVSNCYVDDNNLYIEGIVGANVVYLNDELGSLQSVEIEIPYVLDKKVDFNNDVILESFVALCDVDVMVKRGREIYFDAKAKALVNVTTKNNISMIEKVENIEKLPAKDGALEIYFAKSGQSFWDIAKNLKIPAELIQNQNPDLADPLEKDESIAIYYQKQKG